MKCFVVFSLSVLLFTISSCVKQDDMPESEVKSFDELVVPSDFTWSGISRYNLSVMIKDLSGVSSTLLNGQPMDLVDMDGNRMQRVIVEEGKAEFSVLLDNNLAKLMVSDPVSGRSVQVKVTSSETDFTVSSSSSYQSLSDMDKDGVADLYDDFPSDASKSFVETFPASASYAVNSSAGSVLTKADPSDEEYYFQIFEDLWPSKGDFDMNDLIVASRITWVKSGNYISSGSVNAKIWAVGAAVSLSSGLGYEFFKSGSGMLYYLNEGTVTLASGEAYTHQDEAVSNGIVFWDNILGVVNPYYNNVGGDWGVSGTPKNVSFSFSVLTSAKVRTIDILPYYYYTKNKTHQIRFLGSPPTISADMSLFGTEDDDSPTSWTQGGGFNYPLQNTAAFYRTSANHPWGVQFISNDFRVPLEKTSIIAAYPQFQEWAESGGSLNPEWYYYPDEDLTIPVLP